MEIDTFLDCKTPIKNSSFSLPIAIFRGVLLLLAITCMPYITFAQHKPKQLLQKAELLYENQKYRQALPLYLAYLERKKGKPNTQLQAAICLYHTNRIEEATSNLLQLLQRSKKTAPHTYLYLAKCHHSNLDFEKAADYYKRYLAQLKENDPQRAPVRDAIRRCGNGIKVSYADKPALVENLGDKVNSEYDDFAPVISPNYASKLYFSSARPSSIGGLRNAEGLRDDTFGTYSSDMYYTTIYNGEWTATTTMNALLNTPRNDVILDFNEDGSVLFFYKGYNLMSGEIFVDTFSNENNRLYPPIFSSPMIAENGDGRPDFFKDSIVIFDSRRAGGYGGSDLYYMIKKDNTWSLPQNMGASVNSPYDETTPFLAADGRTLYFSSNNSHKSIGGMDIFKCTYDYQEQQWSVPVNVGIPLNSAGDDLFFSLSKDGLQGYFSSNRRESLGKNDIFVAYFKEKQTAQTPAVEVPFSFVEKPIPLQNTATLLSDPNTAPNTEVQTFDIESLYYTNDDDILNPQNITRLNTTIQALKTNPAMWVLLSCHSDGRVPSQFELYFSIKRAEKAAQYLIQNGVAADRILLRGLGDQYPIAQNTLNGQPNEMGQQLNRRIDVHLLNNTNATVYINQIPPQVSTFMRNETGMQYLRAVQGLSYKIQIGALRQMYKGKLLNEQPDPLVERHLSSDIYQYTVGLYRNFAEAKQLQQKLIQQGHTDVFVVPYIDGRRISIEEARNYTSIYPDIYNFVH